MNDGGKVVFTELSEYDKEHAITSVSRFNHKILIWPKGSKTKTEFSAGVYNSGSRVLLVEPKDPNITFIDDPVLVNFTVEGLNYFSSSELKKGTDGFYIRLSDKLFKSERRKNFRVSFVRDENCFVVIPEKNGQRSSITKLQINDISVTGVSILIDKDFATNYNDNQIIEEMRMAVRSKTFLIPKAEIVYRMDFSGAKGGAIKKLAMQFQKLPFQVEEDLYQLLTKEMRSVDIGSDFEDFLG